MSLYIALLLPLFTLGFGFPEHPPKADIPSTSTHIKLYQTSYYYAKENGRTRTAFLNISETFFGNSYTEDHYDENKRIILIENDLSKDTITLTANQRSLLLKSIGVSESDQIFIYQIGPDVIQTFNVKDVPVIACLNIYISNTEYRHHEYDYEFGFDLGKNYTGRENFTFVGKENPFQQGQLKPIIWKQISHEDFPKKFSPDIILDRRKEWLLGYQANTSFKFSYHHLDYYIQTLKNEKQPLHRYMIVVNSKTKEIIYENVQIDSESTHLLPLNTTQSDESDHHQWTGQLFKDHPVIFFGFLGFGFGCPSLTVLDQSESSIPVLCDNRH